jgi:hypothetical protein
MSIVRIHHDKANPYLVVVQTTVRDRRLKPAARMFLLEVLCLPDDWSFSIRGLAKELRMSRTTIMKHLQAIIEAGYCMRRTLGRLKGQFKYSYTIYETPELTERLGRETSIKNLDWQTSTRNEDWQKSTSTSSTSTVNRDILSIEPTEYKECEAAASPAMETIQEENGNEGETYGLPYLARLFEEGEGEHSITYKQFVDEFFDLHVDTQGTKPKWTGKEGKLLKADLKRLGDNLSSPMVLYFRDPPADVTRFCEKAGWGYNVFHSQIDRLLAALKTEKARLAQIRVCPHCHKKQEHTGVDCLFCQKPLNVEDRHVG